MYEICNALDSFIKYNLYDIHEQMAKINLEK